MGGEMGEHYSNCKPFISSSSRRHSLSGNVCLWAALEYGGRSRSVRSNLAYAGLFLVVAVFPKEF